MVTSTTSPTSANANLRNGYDFPYSGNRRRVDRAERVSAMVRERAVRVDHQGESCFSRFVHFEDVFQPLLNFSTFFYLFPPRFFSSFLFFSPVFASSNPPKGMRQRRPIGEFFARNSQRRPRKIARCNCRAISDKKTSRARSRR